MWVLLVRGSAGAFVASHGLGKGKGGSFWFRILGGFFFFFLVFLYEETRKYNNFGRAM